MIKTPFKDLGARIHEVIHFDFLFPRFIKQDYCFKEEG